MRSTFAVRETASLGIMGAPRVPPLPLRVNSALKALSTLRGLRGAPEVPPLCRETQSLGEQMLKEPLGINGLNFEQLSYICSSHHWNGNHDSDIKN